MHTLRGKNNNLKTPDSMLKFSDLCWENLLKLNHNKASLCSPIIHEKHQNKDCCLFIFFPVTGVLLYGPPGCGKTLIAKATAKASGCRFINLQPSTLTDKWYGESQKLTAAVFSLAVKIQPCIVFIDEIGNYWICSKHLPDISGFQTDKKNITMPACWTL